MKNIFKEIRKGFLITIVLMLICGVVYPLLLTGISQVIFKDKANGSLVEVNGKAVGSELVGQDFKDERFMKCRPSAVNYNTYTQEQKDSGEYVGVASGSNNYGPSNPALMERVQKDMDNFLKNNPTVKKEDIPTDLLTSSGSGLDPHITKASAKIQIPALAKATGITEDRIEEIVNKNTEGKTLGIFGEERVNVLKVNLDIANEIGMI